MTGSAHFTLKLLASRVDLAEVGRSWHFSLIDLNYNKFYGSISAYCLLKFLQNMKIYDNLHFLCILVIMTFMVQTETSQLL